jgi:hypothetical protein
MKMENKIWISYLMIPGITLFLFYSCTKEGNLDTCLSTDGQTTSIFNPNKDYGLVTDQNGNVYKTITIGSQTWMAENLRATCYRNGRLFQK